MGNTRKQSPTLVGPLEWDAFLTQYAEVHLLQTTAWGELKAAFGWQVVRVISGDCGAQILLRRLIPGMYFAYIAKGPVGDGCEPIWPAIDAFCKQNHVKFLKVEPDQWIDQEKNNRSPRGFRSSAHTIQPLRTIVVDLTGDEDTILRRMKQKTRYNIKLAKKKNVVIRATDDISNFYNLMQVTGNRDQFGVHSLAYYQHVYKLFHSRAACELLLAEYQGEPLAGIMVFSQGKRAWYLYGASSNEHRDRMPTYLLQWEAMRWARRQGCVEYDLWGVPDVDETTLETEFTSRSDGLWGVYRNKRGFGGKLLRAAGPWDRIYSPLVYHIYTWWVSRRIPDHD